MTTLEVVHSTGAGELSKLVASGSGVVGVAGTGVAVLAKLIATGSGTVARPAAAADPGADRPPAT